MIYFVLKLLFNIFFCNFNPFKLIKKKFKYSKKVFLKNRKLRTNFFAVINFFRYLKRNLNGRIGKSNYL